MSHRLVIWGVADSSCEYLSDNPKLVPQPQITGEYTKGIFSFLEVLGVGLDLKAASIFDFFSQNIYLDPWATDR